MDEPMYQRIVTESHLDAECQKFVKPTEGRRDGR